MNAVSRLFFAVSSFDDRWRAHAASMRAATVLSFSKNLAPNLGVALQFAKGFDPKFDHTTSLEDLFDELDYLKSEDYKALRINCLLGLCASFESFAKTFIAALSYEPAWKQNAASAVVLTQDTDHDFADRFADADKRWKKLGYCELLRDEFDWVDSALIDSVGEVFWLRNQVAHNAEKASKDRELKAFGEVFKKGQEVIIDQARLGRCVNLLRKCVEEIADGTPYMEAI
jgi:hypothetical protein